MNIIAIQNVRGYLDANNTAWLNAADVANGLGFTKSEVKDGKTYKTIRWARMNEYLSEFGFDQKVGEEDYIPENMFYRLVWKSRDEKAIAFQELVADEILPTIRKTGSYSANQSAQIKGDEVKIIGEMAADIQSVFATKRGIALSQAIDLVSEVRQLKSLQGLKKLLPPADHDTGFLNATHSAKDWRITEEMPYTRNGHSGYQIRWNEEVIPIFRG